MELPGFSTDWTQLIVIAINTGVLTQIIKKAAVLMNENWKINGAGAIIASAGAAIVVTGAAIALGQYGITIPTMGDNPFEYFGAWLVEAQKATLGANILYLLFYDKTFKSAASRLSG